MQLRCLSLLSTRSRTGTGPYKIDHFQENQRLGISVGRYPYKAYDEKPSNKIRSLHPERRRIRDEHLISRSLRIKRSAFEHCDLNAGVVLRSNGKNILAAAS